jgi:hypothetical protein
LEPDGDSIDAWPVIQLTRGTLSCARDSAVGGNCGFRARQWRAATKVVARVSSYWSSHVQ